MALNDKFKVCPSEAVEKELDHQTIEFVNEEIEVHADTSDCQFELARETKQGTVGKEQVRWLRKTTCSFG